MIRGCTNEKEALRYENVNEILTELQKSDRRQQKHLQIWKNHLKATVAVIGTHHCVGTTHIATGLTYCCNMACMKGVYVEQTANQWLKQSDMVGLENHEGRKKVSDLLQKGQFLGLPANGPFYEPVVPERGVFIRDMGVLWDGFCPEAYEKVVLVLGTGYWEENETLQYISRFREKKNCIFVCSKADEHRVNYLSKKSGVSICCWGEDKDIFHISRRKLRLINRLLENE